MAQIINLIITIAEMMGLRGVSSYSRSSNVYNAIGIVILSVCIFLNVYLVKELYETKRQMAYLKIEAKEITILKNRLIEKEAAIQALSQALSMFVPEDAAARFREKQKELQNNGMFPQASPAPKPVPSKPEPKFPAKPAVLPQRDKETDPDKKYL